MLAIPRIFCEKKFFDGSSEIVCVCVASMRDRERGAHTGLVEEDWEPVVNGAFFRLSLR